MNLGYRPRGAFVESTHGKALNPANSPGRTVTRRRVSTTMTPAASGTLFLVAVPLEAGDVITHLNWLGASNNAFFQGTHQWSALFDSARNLVAVSADKTTEAWAADTVKTYRLTVPYVVTVSGLYYMGLCAVATTTASLVAANGSIQALNIAPVLAGASNTGMTTPPTIPFQANAPVAAVGGTPYGWPSVGGVLIVDNGAMTVTNTVPFATSPVATNPAQPSATDIPTLKAIADAFLIPSHVLDGTGTVSTRRAVMTDDDIEKTVRDWIYRNCNWTGTNETTSPALAHSAKALELYRWKYGGTGPTGTTYPSSNAALNGGIGPTMSCYSIHNLYLGFLAAYGIQGREVFGSKTDGNLDITAEYWSPSKATATGSSGWVHVLAHTNTHMTVDATGQMASLFDWIVPERANSYSRIGIGITTVNLGGSNGLSFHHGFATNGWAGYSASNYWERGNWHIVQFDRSTLGYDVYTPGDDPARRFPADAYAEWTTDTTHINYTINTLDVEQLYGDPFITGRFRDQMHDLGHTEVQVPGSGTWVAVTDAAYHLATTGTYHFRAIGTLGNVSNTVTLAVA